MDKNLVVKIIGLCIFTQFAISLANVTDTSKSNKTLTEDLLNKTSTAFSLTEIAHSELTTNATTEPSVLVTESSKGKKTRLLKERSRQDYGFSIAKYGLFDLCPQLPNTCPVCTDAGIQVPSGFCNLVVLKVLSISPPQNDGIGRVCGKFGMLKVYGDVKEIQFRRLLRFSVWDTCQCAVKASGIYFLMAPLSHFIKDGALFNKIELSNKTILISADRYIEKEILGVLNNCRYVPAPLPPPQPPAPYVPPPAPYVPPPAPYVPPPVPYVSPPPQPPAPYVPSPAPYVPPSPTPAPYVPPPAPYVPPPAPYVPPPVPYVPPPAPYVPPSTQPPTSYTPSTSSPLKQLAYRGKMPFIYPSLTKCWTPDTCPICSRLEYAGDITGQYCVAGFAYLAVIRVPDSTTLQGADSIYSGSTCMNLRTNVVYDVTRTREPQIVISALMAMLPTKCVECFKGLSGPVIVLIMGQVPPVPPAVQLDSSFQVYILPVPSTIGLPNCDSYYMYGRPTVAYSLVPVAPQPYGNNDCPEAGDQTCPLCQNYPDAAFAKACANGFAIITELNLAGPYFTSQRLPSISVKTTTTYFSKSTEVIIANPPPIECIKGFFKIIQSIGLAPLNFPGEIIPFVSLPNCECISQGFKRLLIFSSGPLIISPEGVLHLSKDINIAFLQPDDAMPFCGNPPPIPRVYISPQQHEVYTPPYHHPLSPYTRPARVPLTYIPPPPPPPAYIPPSESPVYILPPDYIPPPVKESPLLPSLYIHPQPPAVSPVPPASQPPPHTSELPFEEPPPPIIGCIEFGNGSCVIVDTNQDNETVFSINVNEDIPFPPQYEALNSIIYEDSSVWAPSFEECLSSVQPSCPHSMEKSLEKFEEFFCKAKTALIVAVGIDYSNIGNETAATKRLTFIQPELPYVGMNYGVPKDPVSVTVAVTRNKTMERKIQLQDNADYCYKEKVLVLADLSNVLKPHIVVGGLDVYIPGFCDSGIFDKAPSYGILLSLQQPSDVRNPVQLTEDFAFIPLPEGKLGIPVCGKLPVDEKTASGVRAQSEKFWVPKNPLESVSCELTEKDNCGEWKAVEDEFYTLPCDIRSAVLVLVQNISAGNSVGPNLEILETSYESGEKAVTLNVELNIDEEDAFSSPQNMYAGDNNRCKYATVRVLKDLSRTPSIEEDDVFTIVGNANCDHPIFKLTNEVVLLLYDGFISANTVVPLDSDFTEIIGIPPGETTISFCNENLPYEAPDKIVQVLDESKTANVYDPFLDASVDNTSTRNETTSEKQEIPPNVESNEVLEASCKGHVDDTCPVCEDFGSISSEVYCKAGLALFAEAIGQEPGDGSCTNGVIASLFDITVSNGVPESKVLKISYTIPSHCSCPALKAGEHLVLLLDESIPNTDELSINLSKGKYLYSTPLKVPFPTCYLEDSVQARSRDVNNSIVLNSPFGELRKIIPGLSDHICPTIDHTCPTCGSMDDKELQDLYCSSEEVLMVSRSKTQKESLRKFTRYGKATFTQHNVAGNYTLEMSIEKYEGSCGLPLADGNCSDSLERFYYDAEDEMCTDFTYTGCGGNTNNFLSLDDCDETCLVEDFCEKGILDIKKTIKSHDNAYYTDNKFHYALPEHCNCWQVFKGEKKGYLLSSYSETFRSTSIQLSRDFHFVPLTKSNKKIQFHCPKDDKVDEKENKTKAPAKSEEKKGWLFG